MQSICEDIEKEHHAIQNSDVVVFFQVSQFVTSFQYHKFLISKVRTTYYVFILSGFLCVFYFLLEANWVTAFFYLCLWYFSKFATFGGKCLYAVLLNDMQQICVKLIIRLTSPFLDNISSSSI